MWNFFLQPRMLSAYVVYFWQLGWCGLICRGQVGGVSSRLLDQGI